MAPIWLALNYVHYLHFKNGPRYWGKRNPIMYIIQTQPSHHPLFSTAQLLMVTLLGLHVQKPKIAYLTFPEVGYCILLVHFKLESKTDIKPDKFPVLYE